jgi:SAM-dependent methyltransferase
MSQEIEIIDAIRNYYLESESAYRNWGKDEEREGVYALHGGFAIEGRNLSHYEEVKELTRQLIKFAQINHNAIVLDAGCGTGALAFEIKSQHPDTKVIGINISPNQIASAEKYREKTSCESVWFSLQDYHHFAFPSGIFDLVIFCESYVHSHNKTRLMEETYRVLKSSGRVVLSDMFLEREPTDEREKSLLEDIKRGWCLPSILRVDELEVIWREIGFTDICFVNHSKSILPSSKRMSEHVQMRISQGDPGSEILKISRRAPIACNQAIESGLIGYYFAKGKK